VRIVINALFLVPNQVGGSETYARGLVEGLHAVDDDNEYVLCLGREAASTFRVDPRRWRIVTSPAGSRHRAVRLALEQVWLPRVTAAARGTLIHSLGYTAPLFASQPRVTCIHDMNYRRHPEDLSAAERLVYASLIPRVALRSHAVLALTEASRADIIRWTGVGSARVSVIPGAPRAAWPGDARDDQARLAAVGLSQPFVLSVAASYPHKNLHRLVQALPVNDEHGREVPLVLVGLRGRAQPLIERAVRERPGAIKVLGWVDDELLASLYRGALALALPSLYEGFGLPILEGMALGTPVLTSNFGAMAEVAGAAAELVDPRDVSSIAVGLRRLTSEPARRAELSRLGLQRASEFSWHRTAELTRAIYSAIC
jgi:glycosyltransferase involved in cell wall biosynthesis